MNKFLTKIVGAALGLTLAIGVGVAVGVNHSEAKEVDATSPVSFTPATCTSMTSAAGEQTQKLDVITFVISNGLNDTQLRIYKNQTATFTADSGYLITSIVFTCTAEDTTKYGPGCFADLAGYSYSSYTGTWTGSATSVEFTAETNQVRATEIVVSYASSSESYGVTKTISNGTLSGSTLVAKNATFSGTLTPSEHYHLPETLTSVTMGGNALVAGVGYTYNSTTGAVTIPSVTGALVITASCVEDAKVTVTYVAGANGTGSDYVVSNQYVGSYTLVDLATTGITANPGYIFKCYTIGVTEYAAGASITLSENTTVTVTFKVLSKTMTILPSNFSTSSYADNTGNHTVGDYTIYTINVMQSSSSIQVKSSGAKMYNTVSFSNGISLVKLVGTGTFTVTFDTTLKTSAGSVTGNHVITGLGSNVTYIVPNTNDTCIYFYLTASATCKFSSIEIFSADTAVEEFAKMYLAAYTCTSSGAVAPTATTNYTVGNIETLYTKLGSGVKTALQNAAENHTESYGADKVKEFGRRYYLIVTNHGAAYDFMSVFSSNSLNANSQTNVNNTHIIVLVVISAISLAAVSGYFVIRRRREN